MKQRQFECVIIENSPKENCNSQSGLTTSLSTEVKASMATIIIKTCSQCGNEFQTNRSAAVFCNWNCYQQSHKTSSVIKVCKTCGKSFEPKRESFNAKQKINYCSWKCRGKAYTERSKNADYSKRFWAKVDKSGDCWLWTGTMRSTKIRRGCFWIAGKRYPAYQIAYKLANKVEDFGGLFVCHRCNNTECVRPEHLYLGTHQDNMNDRKNAGHYARKKPKQ